MSTDEITRIEVRDQALHEFLDRMMRHLTDTEPMMADIAQLMASAAESQFAGEIGPDGQAWPDLAESTKKTTRGARNMAWKDASDFCRRPRRVRAD